MSRSRRNLIIGLGLLLVIAIAITGTLSWYASALAGTPPGPPKWFRFFKRTELVDALEVLQKRGVVRNTFATGIYFSLHQGMRRVAVGTYRVQDGESAQDLLEALRTPARQMVRMPETNWARRDAHLLENHEVAPARDYMEIVTNPPSSLALLVSFPLPKSGLEGYLFPDTYDFPPLLGALEVVKMRLRTFDRKVYKPLGMPPNIGRIVTIASLIELEAGNDRDRALISGVIQNRLNKGIPLQLDASIVYALGKWRRLHFKDYKNVKSPYNLYLHKGLPPTPICSPSLKSIEAAMHPAHHHYLFYVALPNGESLFSTTFEEHKKKIKLRLAALKHAAALALKKPPIPVPAKKPKSPAAHKP